MLTFTPIDIKAGDITYGQRIELGKALADATLDDWGRFCRVFDILYHFKPKIVLASKYVREYERIIEGVRYWVEVESQMLHYEPTQDEQRAGLEQYAKAVGELATLHTIAKEYAQDPDAVYNWKYSKVFGILLNDLESLKYQQRLNNLYKSKK